VFSIQRTRYGFIYAYHRGSGEIAAYTWGSRYIKKVEKLKERLKELGISYDLTVTDNWDSFLAVFV
jgi:IS1 family transposase